MTSHKQTVSGQTSMSGQHLRKRATFLTSEGNNALLPASARDQSVTKGGMIMIRLMFTLSARRVFQTAFLYSTKKCWRNRLGKQNSLLPLGPVIKCLLLQMGSYDLWAQNRKLKCFSMQFEILGLVSWYERIIIVDISNVNIFTGIQGYRIHLDNNGDAQFNLTLMDIRSTPNSKLTHGKFILTQSTLSKRTPL